MQCPFCKSADTKVLDSRLAEGGDRVRRRRECLDPQCAQRFTTYEQSRLKLPDVTKSDGTRAAFDEDKLQRSMRLALQNRPSSASILDEACRRVVNRAQAYPSSTVPSRTLGLWVLNELRERDQIACILYAAVFEKVATIREWRELLEREEQALPESERERQIPLFGLPDDRAP